MWEVIEFDKRDKIGGISTPTIRITLANHLTEREILVIFQRCSRRVFKDEKDRNGRIIQDKEYTFTAGWSERMHSSVNEKCIRDLGIDFDALLTMANLTVDGY